MYVCVCTYVCVCMYVCMYVCVCVVLFTVLHFGFGCCVVQYIWLCMFDINTADTSLKKAVTPQFSIYTTDGGVIMTHTDMCIYY